MNVITSLWRLKQKFIGIFTNENFYYGIIKIVFILVVARVILRYGTKVIERMASHKRSLLDERRRKTIGSLGSNILKYVVYFFVLLMILEQLNFPLQTILAGAGIAGVAIGFGAQSLVKDVISGFFFILEDQFAVGDEIQSGNYRGTVQEIGLRTTLLRGATGEVHILPNGTITQVTNYSKTNSLAVLDIGISYEEDVERVLKLLREEMTAIVGEIPALMSEPEVLGVQELTRSEVKIRITADCEPGNQAVAARELRFRIKTLFDREGIKLPAPTP